MPSKNPKRRKGDTLTEAQKDEITMRIAMFDPVSEIAADLANMGITISVQALHRYNPYAPTGFQKRKALFDLTREEMLKEVSKEPIANKAYRIRRLMHLHHAALAEGDFKEARMALEGAAKEVGEVYSKPAPAAVVVPVDSASLDAFTIEEQRNMLADRLAAALRVKPAGTAATKH